MVEGREGFARLGLAERALVPGGRGTVAFCWSGDRAIDALVLAFRARGIDCSPEGPAVRIRGLEPAALTGHLVALAEAPPPIGSDLVRGSRGLRQEKHDQFLPPDLLAAEHAARALDLPGAWQTLHRILEQEGAKG